MTSSITGDTELMRKLAKLKDLSSIAPAVIEGATHVKSRIAKPAGYPAAPPYNIYPTATWYERGKGTQYMYADGRIKNYANSEDLGLSWNISGSNNNLTQTIGNDTSYGPWVQGPTEQSAVMAGIGWKTTDDVVKEEEQVVLDRIKARVDQLLATG